MTFGRVPSGGEQDVRRLQVAVQHAPVVGVLDGGGEARHQAGRVRRGHRPGPRLSHPPSVGPSTYPATR